MVMLNILLKDNNVFKYAKRFEIDIVSMKEFKLEKCMYDFYEFLINNNINNFLDEFDIENNLINNNEITEKYLKVIKKILIINPMERVNSVEKIYSELFNEELHTNPIEYLIDDYIITNSIWKRKFRMFRKKFYPLLNRYCSSDDVEFNNTPLKYLDYSIPLILNILDRYIIKSINENDSYIIELINYYPYCIDNPKDIKIYKIKIMIKSAVIIGSSLILRKSPIEKFLAFESYNESFKNNIFCSIKDILYELNFDVYRPIDYLNINFLNKEELFKKIKDIIDYEIDKLYDIYKC